MPTDLDISIICLIISTVVRNYCRNAKKFANFCDAGSTAKIEVIATGIN